jgi:hypothetical protein
MITATTGNRVLPFEMCLRTIDSSEKTRIVEKLVEYLEDCADAEYREEAELNLSQSDEEKILKLCGCIESSTEDSIRDNVLALFRDDPRSEQLLAQACEYLNDRWRLPRGQHGVLAGLLFNPDALRYGLTLSEFEEVQLLTDQG